MVKEKCTFARAYEAWVTDDAGVVHRLEIKATSQSSANRLAMRRIRGAVAVSSRLADCPPHGERRGRPC